jgi:hypothetical protein
LVFSVAALPDSVKSWVLARLAAKRRLRMAAVPPQAADLTPPATDAVNDDSPGRRNRRFDRTKEHLLSNNTDLSNQAVTR